MCLFSHSGKEYRDKRWIAQGEVKREKRMVRWTERGCRNGNLIYEAKHQDGQLKRVTKGKKKLA